MKTFRYDFSGGVNTIADKAVLPDKFTTVADNVDLRSGMPRPFPMPSFLQGASNTTNRIFEFRNKWYTSDKYRDYSAEYINAQDVVYYTEDGIAPRKIVSGADVPLGTRRPGTAPIVTPGQALQPTISITQGYEGSIKTNSVRSYRVASKTTGGISVPSPASVITVIGTSYSEGGQVKYRDDGSVKVTWNAVKGAIAFLVYAGEPGKEQLIATVSAGTLEYFDRGSAPTSSDFASTHDNPNPYTYVYTFERTVNGITNESAPSDATTVGGAGATRAITFQDDDGFYSQENVKVLTPPTTTISITATPALTSPASINTLVYQPAYRQIKFTTNVNHGLVLGDKVLVYLDGDPNYQFVEFDAIPDNSAIPDPKVFYVQNAPQPTGTTGFVQLSATGITLGYAPATAISDGDVLRVAVSNCKGTDGKSVSYIYGKVKVLSPTSYRINAYSWPADGTGIVTSGSIAYVPANGYIKYRKLYRVGGTSSYQLVAKLDPWVRTYVDTISDANLGEILPSFYNDNGIDVLFDMPPVGLSGIERHIGCMFGIDGYVVRWTPRYQPDAWPDTFYIKFPYKPLAIKSFAQALIVLCQDRIYRIEGSDPTRLTLISTGADIGCIAPHSAQVSEKGLFYLSSKGIMLFNGTEAVCLTDQRVKGQFFTSTSYDYNNYQFPIIPTKDTKAYAYLSQKDGVIGGTEIGVTNLLDGVIYAIKSFIHDGRYILYYGSDPSYGASGTIVLDYSAEGMPITTCGVRPIDVHVSATNDCYMLLNNAPPSTTVKITSPT
jgi:hypothetical protein